MSVILSGCTTWSQAKGMEKKLDGKCARMLCAIFKKVLEAALTKQQMYDHLPLISQPIQVIWTRHARRYWRNMDELIMDFCPWTCQCVPTSKDLHSHLWTDTGCSLEGMQDAEDDCKERLIDDYDDKNLLEKHGDACLNYEHINIYVNQTVKTILPCFHFRD